MISASRRWLRRNRTPLAIGFGVIGAGYVATQYVLGKISDARERMSSDRIAREKYVTPCLMEIAFMYTNLYLVFAGDSSRIRRTALSQS